jgi:hypothetical protein
MDILQLLLHITSICWNKHFYEFYNFSLYTGGTVQSRILFSSLLCVLHVNFILLNLTAPTFAERLCNILKQSVWFSR